MVVVGLLTGSLARIAAKNRGRGLFRDMTLRLGGSLMGSALFPVLEGSPEAAWFVMAPVMLVGRPLSSRFSAQCGRSGSSGASSSRAARSAARVRVTPPNIVMLEGGKRTTRPFRCLSAPREGPRRGSDGAAVMKGEAAPLPSG